MDQSEDKGVKNRQDEAGRLHHGVQVKEEDLSSGSTAQIHGAERRGTGAVF